MKAVKYYGTLLVVWIVGCAIADYGLHLGADSWRMLWGAFIAAIAMGAGSLAQGD